MIVEDRCWIRNELDWNRGHVTVHKYVGIQDVRFGYLSCLGAIGVFEIQQLGTDATQSFRSHFVTTK